MPERRFVTRRMPEHPEMLLLVKLFGLKAQIMLGGKWIADRRTCSDRRKEAQE